MTSNGGYRDGESDIFGVSLHRHGNSDHFAQDIQPRAARAAGIDTGVALDQVLQPQSLHVQQFRGASACAEDARRTGETQAVRMPDGNHGFADQEIIGRGQANGVKRPADIDFQQRQVVFGNLGHEFGRIRFGVRQDNLVVDHLCRGVGVRKDVSRRVNHEPTSHAGLALLGRQIEELIQGRRSGRDYGTGNEDHRVLPGLEDLDYRRASHALPIMVGCLVRRACHRTDRGQAGQPDHGHRDRSARKSIHVGSSYCMYQSWNRIGIPRCRLVSRPDHSVVGWSPDPTYQEAYSLQPIAGNGLRA